MMNQDTTNPTPTPTPTVCGNCDVVERRLLHCVRHRGMFRRLCTSCVLKLHPQSYCPTCFIVYDRSPPPSKDTVTCFKCYSSSHSQCVGAHAGNTYICPPCANPKVSIFTTKKVKDREGEGEDGGCREIDKKGAKVLVAAAMIAASSMSKAAVAARVEAEKRAKEAAFTRKRAREALEHVSFLVAKEKMKRKELLSAEASGSGNVSAQERNYKAGNANSAVLANVASVAEPNRIRDQRGMGAVDGPNEVSARLNAVGLKEKEKLQGFGARSVVSGPPKAMGVDGNKRLGVGLREKEKLQGFGGQSGVSAPPNNSAAMDVEDNKRLGVNPQSIISDPFVQNDGNEMYGNSDHFERNNSQGEKANNGLYSVPPVGDQQRQVHSSSGREGTIGAKQ